MDYNYGWLCMLICRVGLTFSSDYSIKPTFTGVCVQDHYQVGGFYEEAMLIEGPTIKGEEVALQQIFDQTYAVGQGIPLEKAIDKFKDEAIMTSKINPYLSVFVAAVSAGMTTIATPSDLTKEINNVLAKLTKAVDSRLELLQEYTDRQIMNFESELIEQDMKFLFLLWANCRKMLIYDDFRLCQNHAYSTIDASLGKYALFYEKMDASDGNLKGLDRNEMKRMEVNLMSFRDYVVLNVFVLKSMIETEKDKLKLLLIEAYAEELKNKTEFFVRYATKAVAAIDEYYKKFKYTCTSADIVCDKYESLSVNKYDTYTTECRCVLVPDFEPQKCHLEISMLNVEVKDPWYERKKGLSSDLAEAMKEYATEKFKEKKHAYGDDDSVKVSEFWESEVLTTVKLANKLAREMVF